MILARVPITALSRFMRHTWITVTVDRYGHLYPAEREAAVAAFDALFQDSPTLLDHAQIDRRPCRQNRPDERPQDEERDHRLIRTRPNG
jgi:transposase